MNCNDQGQPLQEEDIPGASLGGTCASTLTVVALRCWVLCRDTPTKWQKG